MSEKITQSMVGFDAAFTLVALGYLTGETLFYTGTAVLLGVLSLILASRNGDDDD